MKRKGNLYKDICNIDNIRLIYEQIRNNCNNKKAVYNFELNLSVNLYRILERLVKGKYEFSKYHIFLIKEPKYRLIMSENINDKIVNHLISRYILLPALEKKLIDTNVATRINKGSGYAFKYLIKYINILSLEKKSIYVLKIDISKYFYNIDHNILINMLKKDIKDKDALNIVIKVLNTTNYDYVNGEIKKVKDNEIKRIKGINISDKASRFKEIEKIPLYEKDSGLGIGNMTSQILAVYYLNDIDHYIKEGLKCKYYIRYMDDLIILDNELDRLKDIFSIIKNKIEKIDLKVNTKSRIIILNRGFSFLGYTYKVNNSLLIRINNYTFRRIKKHLKKVNYKITSLVSYKGFFDRAYR